MPNAIAVNASKMTPSADHTTISLCRASMRTPDASIDLDRPIMNALLKKGRNLFGVVGAANLVLVDSRRFRLGAGRDAECANDVDLKDGSALANAIRDVGVRPWFAPDELARYMNVVALLEGLGDDGAFPEKGEGEELPVLHGAPLGVVVPILRESSAHKLTASGSGDRWLVSEVSG